MKWKVPFNLQLILTEECNLRCAYCFEIDKKSRVMSPDLAKKLIEKELSADSDFTEFQIDLAGGEPFLYFDEIREIVDFGAKNSHLWGKEIRFFICSNLTVLNDNIKQWLKEQGNFVVLGTSLDGTKDSHNRYRCDSYDAVMANIPFYQELYPDQGVKMTLAPDTIDSLYEGICEIECMGLHVSANVVYEPVWGDSSMKRRLLAKFAEQLDLLVQHYADDPDLQVPNLLSLPIRHLVKPREPEHSWCGSGKTMRAYDIDGRELPCHRFSRFCTDKIYDGPKSIGERVSTKCDTCIFISACPHCPGYNWQIYGNNESRTSNHCEFIKLQLLAAAKLFYLRHKSMISELARGGSTSEESLPSEMFHDIKGAIFVTQNLDVDGIIAGCC